ncbi:MAG: methyltransferase [Hyphomicrobium sp.]|jgi:tRNA1(Val) A37 N6-methylase TrmN6
MSVTDDAFLGGSVQILQPARGYRAGVDAVLLAAAVPCLSGVAERVLDAGAGVGTAGLCVAARCLETHVALLEREPLLIDMAKENVQRNTLERRVSVVAADIGHTGAEVLAAAGLSPHSFDHVIANPPYHVEGAGTPAANKLKAVSHAMVADGLEVWSRFLARMAKPGGTATVIHKAEALQAVLAGFARRFGGIKVLPIHARAGEPAIRVLVQGIAGSKAPLVILAGLTLHEGDNSFTLRAAEVLRLGAALDLDYGRSVTRKGPGE